MNHFLIWLWHGTESGFYTTTNAKPLSDWTKKKLQSTSQSQTCTIKRLWSLFCGLQTVWSTTAFWILAKLLPLRSMLSKSVRYTKTATCSQHWSTKRTQFFSTTATAPYHTSHNQCFKSWTDWATKFCLIHRRPDLSPTDYHFFKHLNNFLERKCFHNQLLLLLLLSCFSRVWLCATP